jgi:hypothetical protein
MPAKFKINLNVVLKHLDRHNLEIYEAFKHKEVERKELDRLLGYVLPIWVSGIASSREQYDMVFQFNEQVNLGWNELKDHPELRLKVLASIGPGKEVRHDFHMRDQKPKPYANLTALLTRRYPDIRPDEIGLWCSVNNETGLIELCDRYGVQVKERDAIFSEYRRAVS